MIYLYTFKQQKEIQELVFPVPYVT